MVIHRWLRATIALAVTAALFALLLLWNPSMLYLPRLFVYHCDTEIGSRQSETFKVMERRLLRVIINPAMIVTWVAGLWLVHESGFFKAGWMHAKFALVIAMSAIHGFNVRWVRAFAEDRNVHSQKFYRAMNEIPTLLMIAIVILVIVKPF